MNSNLKPNPMAFGILLREACKALPEEILWPVWFFEPCWMDQEADIKVSAKRKLGEEEAVQDDPQIKRTKVEGVCVSLFKSQTLIRFSSIACSSWINQFNSGSEVVGVAAYVCLQIP